MSNDDGLTKTAKRIEAVRKIITNTIWIAIVVVVLAAIGRYLVVKDAPKTTEVGPQEKPVVQPIPWHEVDQAIATAITDTRKSTEAFASQQLDEWIAVFMERVDTDFLDWYFSYWTQQLFGLEGLWQYGVNYFFENQPTAAEKLTEEIQEEFSKRVLRPQIAQLKIHALEVLIKKRLVPLQVQKKQIDHLVEALEGTTFATHLYAATSDLLVVKRALGHRDISTTEIYTHLVD